MVEAPLLWTTVERDLDGVSIVLRGELSTATAPALESLLDSLVEARERLVSIDARDARVIPPAGERVLARWGVAPRRTAGVYDFPETPLR